MWVTVAVCWVVRGWDVWMGWDSTETWCTACRHIIPPTIPIQVGEKVGTHFQLDLCAVCGESVYGEGVNGGCDKIWWCSWCTL